MIRFQTPTIRHSGLSASVRMLLAAVACVSICGCANSLLNIAGENALASRFRELVKREPDTAELDDDDDFTTKIETPLLSDYISVSGNTRIALRGVGLVTGLKGTGGDPPPSNYRTELLNEMKRRKVPNPQKILASRDTAMVIVTGYLPPMVEKSERFDVQVVLPPNSEATSLKGGWLLDTRMAEEQAIRGQGIKKGSHDATAGGAILTALGANGATKVSMGLLRRGSVPGGAVSRIERNLEVIIRNEKRGFKTAKTIERAISGRLFHYDRFGQRSSMANAKTDMRVELDVHPLYRNNFPRYQQVIRSIAFRENSVTRRMRMEKLAEDILIPAKANRSAHELEAIGRDSIPFLKAALASPELEVQFHAALALTYLEDTAGVEILKKAAQDEPAFRAHALAALSVTTDADAVVAMRELLSHDTLETRYGAVRALKENSPSDPSLGTTVFPNQFLLHAVDCSGPSAVHVVRYRFPEVVVFGTQQHLSLPATINCGERLRVMGKSDEDSITVTRYILNADPIRKKCSTRLVDVLNTVASMGATYPDVVQMLLEAENQHLLAGELGIDRLPQAGRWFHRTPTEQSSGANRKAKLGSPAMTPGLFERVEESDIPDSDKEQTGLDRIFSKRTDSDAGESGGSFEDAAPEVNPATASLPTTVTSDFNRNSIDAFRSEADESGADEGEFVYEETEFREPWGARMKRIFRNPFSSDDE